MNILLIDRALPYSVYSGKTVRLKNIYGRLAKQAKITYLRTAQAGEEKESRKLERWAGETFHQCLRMPPIPKPSFEVKVFAALAFRPCFDLLKWGKSMDSIARFLSDIVQANKIDLVITFDLEVAQYGHVLSKNCPWIQDLGDSMTLQVKRRLPSAQSLKEKVMVC
jgi:hypothetical protein